MRLPIKEKGSQTNELNDIYSSIENLYAKALMQCTETRDVKVMLGDGSVIDSQTFDPNRVRNYYNLVAKKLQKWDILGIRESQNEDVYRTFFEISSDISKYRLKGYFGIQYRALSYYKVDKEVIAIQKQLREITEKDLQLDKTISDIGNRLITDEINKMGLKGLSHEALFDRILSDPSISEELEKKATYVEGLFPEVRLIEESQKALNNKLKNLLLEIYLISRVLIDYNQLMQGQEGFVMYFDITLSKSTPAQGSHLDVEKINRQEFIRIIDSFNEILASLELPKIR
jgi:hypothetical protein